jgi:hypothetical protein
MKNLFVSYELALKLEAKGFNEPCFGYYIPFGFKNSGKVMYKQNKSKDPFIRGHNTEPLSQCLAPLYQQVVDWLRVKHGLAIVHDMCDMTCSYNSIEEHIKFNLYKVDKRTSRNALSYSADHCCFGSYYEAFDFIINEALNLI